MTHEIQQIASIDNLIALAQSTCDERIKQAVREENKRLEGDASVAQERSANTTEK